MKVVSYDNGADLAALEDVWDRLCEPELRFVPSFAELQHHLRADGRKFRILTAVDNSQVVAMACFLYGDSIKRFEIATRKLFDLPVKEVTLLGSCVAGQANEDVIRKFFQVIIADGGFDVVSVGDILVDSPLYRAITSLHRGVVAWRIMRKQQIRWLIRLPGSFDEYISSLRATTKMRINRDGRRFEKMNPDFRVVSRPEDVGDFLRDAEKISRLTYQWHLGHGLRNDEHTRAWLTRLAEHGTLRCYVAHLQGKPCAFGCGELAHRTFGFHRTGYDPQFRTLSPGTALILRMIRDLIENTNCEVFDFGGGGETGYKSRLGTLGLSCSRMQTAAIYRPYSAVLVSLDQTMNLAKNAIMDLGGWIVGHGALKRRVKSALRPFGIGSY